MGRSWVAEALAAFRGSRPQDVALVLVLATLIGGLLLAGPLSPAKLATVFHLALFIHIVASAHDGRFGRLRTLTWFLLILTWIAAEVGAFISFILPFGQLRFWLAGKFAGMPFVGEWLSGLISGEDGLGRWIWHATLLLILGIDLAAMHYPRWRTASQSGIAILAAGVLAAAIILSPVVKQLTPSTGEILVPLPSWYTLPLYELLRLIPGKLASIGLALAAMLVLLALPGMRADRLRKRGIGWLWFALTAALAAAWIGLGYLGTLPPEGAALWVGRILAALHFAYFLVLPLLLGRISLRRPA